METDYHGVENDPERIDAESDRDTADPNVGRSIRALYETDGTWVKLLTSSR